MDKPTILVVDDEPAVCRLLAVTLSQRGFTVLTAEGGVQAVEAYRRCQANVVLMDVQMASMDGPATLRDLQSINPGVRCCFMSGNPGSYSVADLHDRGALAFLSKPFTPQQVEDAIWRLLNAGTDGGVEGQAMHFKKN